MAASTKPDVSAILKKHAAMRSLYAAVFAYLRSLGPVEAIPHKTQISFGGKAFKTNFAFVWLPQTISRGFPEHGIMLTFDLPRHETSRRIHNSAKLRPGRWVHHVLITGTDDLDSEVKGWLRESYEFGRVGLRGWRKKTQTA